MTTDGEYAIVSTAITRFVNNGGSLTVVDTFAPGTGGLRLRPVHAGPADNERR